MLQLQNFIALNQEIKKLWGSNKPFWEERRGTNLVDYRDGVWHERRVNSRVKGILEKWRPSKPVTKQRDGLFGL